VIRRSPGKTVARCMLIGAAALLVPALAGCEAGLNAPTLQFHPAAGGAQTTAPNDITITNAFVLGPASGSTLPAGSSAGLFLAMYNGGTSDDRLTRVSASGTSSATIEGGSVALPMSASANLTGPEPKVVLSGLTRPLTGGEDITVTLTFDHAGQVSFAVPVEPQSYFYSTYSQPPAATSQPPTATATP
jgi:copper(I)-binding protein